jgi:hypothetical protein
MPRTAMQLVKPPTLAEVIELQERAPGSLESAAASINRHIDLYLRAEISYSVHRLRAGVELIDVRKRIPHGEWEAWCGDNIHRSYRDIQKLMRMAGEDNPVAAFERERSQARERMQINRTKAANVRRLSDNNDPVEHAFQLFLQLDEDQRADFLALVRKEMEP